MIAQPEEIARAGIDRLLVQAGWQVFDVSTANIHAARGVAIREFPLSAGYGFADYLLYVDGKAVGVIEAKKKGATLTGVELQSAKYSKGLPATLPAWQRPLPFIYESTGVETHFTNGLDPEPRARSTFAFHKPDTLAHWLAPPIPFPLAERGTLEPAGQGEEVGRHASDARGSTTRLSTAVIEGGYATGHATFLARMKTMPPLAEAGLWPAQIIAIKNLEQSLV